MKNHVKNNLYILNFLVSTAVLTNMVSASGQSPSINGQRKFEEGLLDIQDEVDIKRKTREMDQLGKNAAQFFKTHSVETAANDFIHKAIWRKGELFPFIFREDGTVIAHGDDHHLIWDNISNIKGIGGAPLIQEMLSVSGGKGHMSYMWNNSYKAAYVEVVQKQGKRYIVGTGFYPENDEYLTKQLVRSAVSFFLRQGADATFALINNPQGPFVNGDIFAFVYDLKGKVLAHGQNSALIGQNLIDQVDTRGNAVTKEIIKAAKSPNGNGWVEFYWRNELKRSYVERVQDPKTKKYYVFGAGYYPNVTLDTVRSFVNRAVRYLKANGAKEAFSEFNNQVGEFAVAGLGVFVYDFKGKNLANGENPSFVGQNLLKQTDQDGHLFVQDIIRTAHREGRGLVPLTRNNSYALAYIQTVDIPDGKFIVGTTYYPASKSQSVRTLVSRAQDSLRDLPAAQVFNAFKNTQGKFYRGDLFMFAYDTKGTRLVNGNQSDQTWRNFMKATDQEGKTIVGNMIAKAINGGGWIQYVTRNATRRVYVTTVETSSKTGEVNTYIIGSGYFL